MDFLDSPFEVDCLTSSNVVGGSPCPPNEWLDFERSKDGENIEDEMKQNTHFNLNDTGKEEISDFSCKEENEESSGDFILDTFDYPFTVVENIDSISLYGFNHFPSRVISKVDEFLLPHEKINFSETCQNVYSCLEKSEEFNNELYKYEIFMQLRTQEMNHVVLDFFKKQKQITPKIRATVVEWMSTIHLYYFHHVHTEFVSVRLLDRVLGVVTVPRKEFQLVAIACILLASKVEESEAPPMDDLLSITQNVFKRQELCQMERVVLGFLGYRLHTPTIISFLKYYFSILKITEKVVSLSFYLAEQSLLDVTVSSLRPSIAAISILCVSLHTFRQDFEEAVNVSKIPREDILSAIHLILNVQKIAFKHEIQAIRKAYCSQKHFGVGFLTPDYSILTSKVFCENELII